MKKITGNTKKALYDNVGKKGKIIENSESRDDLKLAEVTADIVPAQENLNIQAKLPINEVISDQIEITENTAGVTSSDSGYAADLSNPVQFADASGATGDYIQLADASGSAVNGGSTNTSDEGSNASPILSFLSDNWHYLAGGLAAVGAGIGIAAANNGGGDGPSGSNPSGPAEVPEITGFTTDSGLMGDRLTNDNTPTIKGTAGHNEPVKVFIDDVYMGEAKADAEGNWTFDCTETVLDGPHTITAKSNGMTSPSYDLTIDTVPPPWSVDVTMSDTSLVHGETAAVTFTFSEDPGSDFALITPNGTLSNWTATGDPKVFTATFTPNANTYDTTNVISVTDMAGNAAIVTAPNYIVDTNPETVTLNNFSVSGAAQGFSIVGEANSDQSGYSVHSAGDVNGDGLDDLIIGAPYANVGATLDNGKSYVVFGSTGITTAHVHLSAIAAGSGGFVINGVGASDHSGYTVSSAGDVNGDGLDDLIVGAYTASAGGLTGAGKTYVVFGKADTSAVNLSAVEAGNGGFVINGEGVSDFSGISVSSAGDFNGDGLADLIIGARFADPNGASEAGKSYLVYGKADMNTVNLADVAAGNGGFVINGTGASDASGFSVSSAGDVNGDGLADLIVGAFGADPNGEKSGSSYVIFGRSDADTTPVDLSDVAEGSGGFVINGASGGYTWSGSTMITGDKSGWSVSSAGDVNGDGLSDLIVGALNVDQSAGAAYVVFGKEGTEAVDLANLGAGGFAIHGVSGNGWPGGDYAGYSVSSAGDVNGDGLSDLVVGAYGVDSNGTDSGQAYVVFGKTDNRTVELSSLAHSSEGFIIDGGNSGMHTGYSVSAAGDLNGDGLADLLVGANYATGEGVNPQYAGQTFVIFGGMQNATDVDQLGTSGADTLTGTAASETIVAGDGNDTIYGNGGADVLYGGHGDDTIYINADNIAKLSAGITDGNYARIDGGGNVDTVNLDGSGITFDLTAIANQGGSDPGSISRIESIEKVDITGSGNNTLTISINDVLDMSGTNVFNGNTGWSGLDATVDKHQLAVIGDAGDTVNLSGGWVDSGADTLYSGHAYHVYNAIDIHAQILIDTNINQSDIHILA